jgi:uncharacterized protein
MFDISKLKNNTEETLTIDENITFDEKNLEKTEIKRLENIKATGNITRLNNSVYHLTLKITGNMVLSCARSLEEVEQPLNIYIDKNIEEDGFSEEKQLIFQNGLDIFGIVWENIVLEVPLRVVKEDAKILNSGDGWSLIDENKKTNNSPFSELKSMLDMEGKE